MKKTFQIYILILFCSSFAKAQIIEFENEIILNVPDKFIYVENDLNSEMMSDLVDFLGDNNKSYLIGTKDSVEFTREYQNDPEALMEPINQKMNRKNFQSETSMINFMIKELKSMMKKRNYESVIWLIISNENIRDTNEDLYQIANEVKAMDNRTLKKELISYQKEWKSYVSNFTSGLNKYLKVSKLVVENNNQIPSAEFSIIDIAEMIKIKTDCEINIKKSNDPRSYRQDSSKILDTGFVPKKKVENAIDEIIDAYSNKILKDTAQSHTVDWMMKNNIK